MAAQYGGSVLLQLMYCVAYALCEGTWAWVSRAVEQ